MIKYLLIVLFFIPGLLACAQQKNVNGSVFERISADLKDFKIDTTKPPSDRKTNLILKLREVKGGFNINEAISFKLEEDRKKGEINEENFKKLSTYFNEGHGKLLLENAMIWMYRNTFSVNELKQMVRFFKTPAGKKYSDTFPVIMLRSLMIGQLVKDSYR